MCSSAWSFFMARIFQDPDDSRSLFVPPYPVAFRRTSISIPIPSPPKSRSLILPRPHSSSDPHIHEDGEDRESLVEDLKIPDDWLLPSKAVEESEWLRVTLHKWLDDEYCPEPTNVEISSVAAKSYYGSLLERQTDLGLILLKLVRDLESISYQESFHGAFSSANAAVNLIIERIGKL